jgi:hypothetical protein
MNKEDIKTILKQIKYKDWRFLLREKEGVMYLQIKFDAPDNYTGVMEEQSCRKFMLSTAMVKSEIVETAWLAVQRAELHEAGENFWYKGVLPYCPHIDIDARVEMMRENRIDVRPELVK